MDIELDDVFIAGGIAVLAYLLVRATRSRPSDPVSERPPPSLAAPQRRKTPSTTVLVINASNRSVIEALREQGALSAVTPAALYEGTQALWHGPTDVAGRRGILNGFDGQPAVEGRQETEYDVYHVRFALPDLEDGFAKDAVPSDRIDAFETAAAHASDVTVSDRLPASSYGSPSTFYAR